MNLLRWILVVPAAAVAWHVALFAGIAVLAVFERHCNALTPECSSLALDIAVFCGASLSAVFVITAAVFVAPSRKRTIAWLALLGGAIVAAAVTFEIGASAIAPCGGALFFGFATASLFDYRERQARFEAVARDYY